MDYMEHIEYNFGNIESHKDCPDNNDDELILKIEEEICRFEKMIEKMELLEFFKKQYMQYVIKRLHTESGLYKKKIDSLVELITEQNKIKMYDDSEIDSYSHIFLPEYLNNAKQQIKQTDQKVFFVCVDKYKFVESIIEVYNTNASILSQFIQDFHRGKMIINDIIYTNIDELFYELSRVNRMTKIRNLKDEKMSTFMLSLLLMCQTSHYMSYMYPFNAINELKKHNTKYDDYNVLNSNKQISNTINITIDRINVVPEMGCSITSCYEVFDVKGNFKVYDITVETIFKERAEIVLLKYIID